MQDDDNDIDDDDKCVAECNIVVGRETRLGDDGHPVSEMVERCTRCGLVFVRESIQSSGGGHRDRR